MKCVLATANVGKLREMQALLAPYSIELVAQSAYNTPEAIEDGLSFVENAIIKARNAARHCGLPAIADDSGLEVDALRGAPGIYSARYAGAHGDTARNNKKLLQALEGVADVQRAAQFRCVVVFMRHAHDPSPLIAEGCWRGRISTYASGDNGFGYDPLFYLEALQCSAAQLSAAQKNALSHRGQALRALCQRLAVEVR